MYYPILDCNYYNMWPLKMEMALESHELWEAVDLDGDLYVKGVTEYHGYRLALITIHSIVPNDLMQHLIEKKTAKEV